jgi:hypothetical protein
MLSIYKHQGEGHYIGSCVVVIAESLEAAKIHIRDLLDTNGLPNEKLSIDVLPIVNGCKIVDINGNY